MTPVDDHETNHTVVNVFVSPVGVERQANFEFLPKLHSISGNRNTKGSTRPSVAFVVSLIMKVQGQAAVLSSTIDCCISTMDKETQGGMAQKCRVMKLIELVYWQHDIVKTRLFSSLAKND